MAFLLELGAAAPPFTLKGTMGSCTASRIMRRPLSLSWSSPVITALPRFSMKTG